MMRSLALMLLCAGCATKTAPVSIMPPKVKVKSVGTVPKPKTEFTLRWEDCAEQPTNAWYRIYETNWQDRWLYAQVTNAHSLVIPMTKTAAFFTVEVTDGQVTKKAGRACE